MNADHIATARAFRKKHPSVCRQLDWQAKDFADGHREVASHMRNDPPDRWPESAINGAVCYCMAVSYGVLKPLVANPDA